MGEEDVLALVMLDVQEESHVGVEGGASVRCSISVALLGFCVEVLIHSEDLGAGGGMVGGRHLVEMLSGDVGEGLRCKGKGERLLGV